MSPEDDRQLKTLKILVYGMGVVLLSGIVFFTGLLSYLLFFQ